MDLIIYYMDFKTAQHVFPTIFQTCTLLVIIGIFFKDVIISGKHSRQVNKYEIMTAMWVFFSFVLLTVSGSGTHPKYTLKQHGYHLVGLFHYLSTLEGRPWVVERLHSNFN